MPTTIVADASSDRSARGIAAARQPPDHRPADARRRRPACRRCASWPGGSASARRPCSEAWQTLADVGAIETRGRAGTFVRDADRPARPPPLPPRHRGARPLRASTCPRARPTRSCSPTSARCSPASARQALTTSYLDDPVLPGARRGAPRARWPFPPEALTVVDGAMDALDRVAAVVVRLGDRVLVENPGFPPLLDLLEQLGAEPIGARPRRRGRACPTRSRPRSTQRPVAALPPAPGPQPDRRQHDAGPGQRAGRRCSRPTDAS